MKVRNNQIYTVNILIYILRFSNKIYNMNWCVFSTHAIYEIRSTNISTNICVCFQQNWWKDGSIDFAFEFFENSQRRVNSAWNMEKVDYYSKTQYFTLIDNMKTTNLFRVNMKSKLYRITSIFWNKSNKVDIIRISQVIAHNKCTIK